MKFKVFILMFILVISSMLFAETPQDKPKQMLKQGDVENLIKTFPKLKTEMEQLGASIEAKSGNVTIPDAIKASNKYDEILKKNGCNEEFYAKLAVIVQGYSIIVYGSHLQNLSPEIQKSLKELDENPDIDAETKKTLKKQMLEFQGALNEDAEQMKSKIHPNDLNLIKPLVEELKKVLE